MKWVRRVAAAPLLLLALICAIGAVRIFTRDLPDDTFGTGVFTAIFAAAAGAGAFFLLRPDLRELSLVQVRAWAWSNPLGQALLHFAIAAVVMAASPEYQLAPAVLAVCIYSVTSAWSAALQQRWWAHAALAVLGFCALFLALAAISEAIARRGFGEGAMLFLLPLQAFPILLVASGIVRWVRGSRAKP
jgi:hypothetical protein